MKKTLLALSLALASTTAFAQQATLESEETIKAYGTAMMGAYGDTGSDDRLYNGGATGVDVFVDYRNGNFIAQYGVEADLDQDHSMDDATFNTIDAWFGFVTPAGNLTAGVRGDSALDAVDASGDVTVEFGNSVEDANDVGSFVKLEGKQGFLQYGVSYYGDRNVDEHNVNGMNGYVGYVGQQLTVNVGMEMNEGVDVGEVEDIYLIASTYKLGNATFGASYGHEVHNGADDHSNVGITAGYNLTEKAYVAAGYFYETDTRNALNAGGKYQFTPRLSGMVDVAVTVADHEADGEVGVTRDAGDVQTFARLDYKF